MSAWWPCSQHVRSSCRFSTLRWERRTVLQVSARQMTVPANCSVRNNPSMNFMALNHMNVIDKAIYPCLDLHIVTTICCLSEKWISWCAPISHIGGSDALELRRGIRPGGWPPISHIGGSDTRGTLCNDCSGFQVCQNLHKPKGGILMSEVSKILRTFVV